MLCSPPSLVPAYMRRGGTFLFSFSVPAAYPHDPPKVKCLTKVGGRKAGGCACADRLAAGWEACNRAARVQREEGQLGSIHNRICRQLGLWQLLGRCCDSRT